MCRSISTTVFTNCISLPLPEPPAHAAFREDSSGHHAQTIEHRASYQEAFVEELRAWHRAITAGGEIENSVEEARRDIALIGEMGRVAAAAQRA